MFDTICTLPLTSELFAQSIHPRSPILALGLASGHVQLHRLPPCSNSDDGSPVPEPGHGTIETAWRTHRHKGSCRSLSFSPDGAFVFSAGADGIVKAAVTETGRVVSKIATPQQGSSVDDPASVIHVLTPQSFLLATDSSALHIYDLRADSSFATTAPQQTYRPHDDYISSISPLPSGASSKGGSGRQWISTGGTTIALTDLRKGVVAQGRDLGEELFCGAVVGSKVVVGGERGILRMCELGAWDRAEERVVVGKVTSLDVLSTVPQGVGGAIGNMVAVGMEHGAVKIVALGKRKVVAELRHDEVEGVAGLGFEIGGRMISGGGQVVKVWQESTVEGDEGDAGLETVNGDGSSSEQEQAQGDSDDDQDESSDDEKRRSKRMKRKRNKGHAHGPRKQVITFKGMD